MGEEGESKGLAEYVKLSVNDLRALQKSYDDKIERREKNHWISKAQKKVKFDIRKVLRKTRFVTLGIYLLFSIGFLIGLVMLITGSAKLFVVLNWFMSPNGFIVIIFFMMPALILSLSEDGTRELYRERNKIDLILKNKQKPNKSEMPNPRAVFILKLLAKYSTGLNRADIKKLSQKEFGKSLDTKTIDEYLKQLSYAIEIVEKAYRSPTGGNDSKKTKVYTLTP